MSDQPKQEVGSGDTGNDAVCRVCFGVGSFRAVAGYAKLSTDDPRSLGTPIYGLITPCFACDGTGRLASGR